MGREELARRVAELEAELLRAAARELHWRIRAEVSEGLIGMLAAQAERS
jgi:hypothetical protein